MDILIHAFSGVSAGTVVSSLSNRSFKHRFLLIVISGIGGILPDLDAISLWSKFDSSIGALFGLTNSGRDIYFSKLWYSHHAFLHSLFASLLIVSVLIILASFNLAIRGEPMFNSIKSVFKKNYLLYLSFISGFVMHIIGDLPTPSCVWDGVDLFWPFGDYVGGTGDTWWWNNYDVFIISVLVVVINLIFHLFRSIIKAKLKLFTTVTFIIGLSLASYQIKNRGYDFNFTGFTSKFRAYEKKSKEIQKEILGEPLYDIMVKFDNMVKINF